MILDKLKAWSPVIVLAVALVASATIAMAGTVEIRKTGSVAISTITADAFNGGLWTGWINVNDKAAVCFDVTYVRAAATGVTMRCETSEASTTTADAGFDLHAIDIAGGALSSYPMTWTYTSSASKSWSWCVDDLPGKYVNCLFDDLASGGATDYLTVVYRVVTP